MPFCLKRGVQEGRVDGTRKVAKRGSGGQAYTARAVSPFFSVSVTGTSCSSAMGTVLARG